MAPDSVAELSRLIFEFVRASDQRTLDIEKQWRVDAGAMSDKIERAFDGVRRSIEENHRSLMERIEGVARELTGDHASLKEEVYALKARMDLAEARVQAKADLVKKTAQVIGQHGLKIALIAYVLLDAVFKFLPQTSILSGQTPIRGSYATVAPPVP